MYKWFEGFCIKAEVSLYHSLLGQGNRFWDSGCGFGSVLEVEDNLCQRDLSVGSVITVDHGTDATGHFCTAANTHAAPL